MITRSSDDGVSRMSLLFTAVGVLIAASVVSLVLVNTENGSSGSGMNAAAAAPASAPMTVVPTSEAPVSTPAPSASTSPVARSTKMPARSTKTPAKSTTSETPATRKPITYTVKKGDNLTVIAAWFKLHGYGDLYARNRKVIGSDPDLIRPGQRITVSSDGMTISK